ncbi:MAG: DUF5050 domain-containing protein [Lachnospiraceae bacterium]|jgi:hypothetical protein|nr:DUF5050 domain-containing protein [Lachnospiraceae bacterium]
MPSNQKTQTPKKKKGGFLRFLPFLIAIVIITVIAVTFKLLSRTVPNDPDAIGNTACNLYNGGTFCLYDDRIYFSNLADDGALYSMKTDFSGYKKLTRDMPGYLNATSHYLVYARLNYLKDGGGRDVFDYTSSGLFRIDRKNGAGMRMIYNKPVGIVSLQGNDIYYQHYDEPNLTLYHAPLDCSETTLLLNSSVLPACVQGGLLYYAGTSGNHYIYSLTVPSGTRSGSGSPILGPGTETLIYQGNCYQPARVGDSIYFISLSQDYSIARVDPYGSHPTLLVQEHCSFYNVDPTEHYLIYQVDSGERNRLECLDLYTLETTTILEGNYCNIHILDDLVFFQEFGTKNQYYFRLDTPGDIRPFVPEVKK